jgi:hypothetical protein
MWKNCFLAVTPVKTGVRENLQSLKIPDSGFCRNDGEMAQTDFCAPSDPGGRAIHGKKRSK